MLRMLSWNVNGIRSVHRKGFVSWLSTAQADIVCLQETKASERDLPFELTAPPGYTVYFFGAARKGYSGVALYTKQKPQQVHYGIGEQRFDSEGRVLIADYGDFVLFNVYCPNGQRSHERLTYKLDFYKSFLTAVMRMISLQRSVIVCGDINTAHRDIDLARPRENAGTSGFLPEERAWIDELLRCGFIDTFRMFNSHPGHYTWWDMKSRARERNVGWRLDYFFVSENLRNRVCNAYILSEVMGSDHCPVGLEMEQF